MSSSLKSLKIEHLRGSVTPFTLNFATGKKLTVIYGENGTGKTTICDALEFISKGKIGSLENKGLGPKASNYWPSLGKKASDITVTLCTHDSSCVAKLAKSSVIVTPEDKRPRVEVLRRGQILGLVEAKPAERYSEIKRFIDVSGAENSEASLRELIKNLERSRETAIARVQENQTAISQFWETAGKPAPNALSWAQEEAKRDLKEIDKATETLSSLRASYVALVGFPAKWKQNKLALEAAITNAVQSETQLKLILEKTTQGAEDLVDILKAAKKFLGGEGATTACPLCESSENAKNLGSTIDTRLAQFQEITSAKQKRDAAVKVQKDLENAQKKIQSELSAAVGAYEQKGKLAQASKEINLPKDAPSEDFEKIQQWLIETAQLAEEWLKLENDWKSLSKFIDTLKKAVKQHNENYQQQKQLDVLLPQLRNALEIVTDERIKFTDGILKKIADEVGQIYEKVHPSEGLDKISLELDPDKRASLEIGTSFGGQDNTPPQAYFSQSHLDTLGLCVFLALSARENPEETILILDDVLASVDEPHVDRLIEMLYSEALKFKHCIITTHYGPWRHKLRWGWLQNGQCHFTELTKWSIKDGLKQIDSIPELERLRAALASPTPDLQLICSKAGVVLEAALDFITQLYECHMPRRQDARYTIGDYLPAIDKKLKPALRVEVANINAGVTTYTSIQLSPMIDELIKIAQTRNLFGAHFNKLSFEMLDSDALSFGQLVLQLVETLVDPENGWPRSSKSGSYWATYKETRRLHPLKRPA